MQTLAVQFLDQGFHRVLFDAMPLPVFVVDWDLVILEYNAAAARLVGHDKPAVLSRRGGDVLHCIHAHEVPEGCGRAPACADCLVRRAVQLAGRGEKVVRLPARLERLERGKRSDVEVRISCTPVTCEDQGFFLLVFEGLD